MNIPKLKFQTFVVLVSVFYYMLPSAARTTQPSKISACDIVFSARFYLKPDSKKPNAKSRFHLYRINAEGKGKTQITFGAHDDEFPLWTQSGRRIVFLRDDKSLLQCDENGKKIVKLLDVSSANDAYWNGLKVAQNGKTVGFLRSISTSQKTENTLFLVDLTTRKTRQIADVEHYSWSRDNRFLALEGGQNGFRVLDLRSQKTRKMKIENLGRFAWISSADLVATIQKPRANDEISGVESFQIFNLSRKLQTFKIAPTDDELCDWRSFVLPIPQVSNAFTFVSDESTSSGRDAIYFRVSTISGQMMRLAEGQSFAWAPSGNRFLVVSYHDTTPYDVLPNGHKRVVYTTKLRIGTGEKDLRDLVSGLVLVESADWRDGKG